MKFRFMLIAVLVIAAVCGCDFGGFKDLVTPLAVETISEYGVYFGAKGLEIKNDKIDMAELGFRGIILALEDDAAINIDDKIKDLPDFAKKFIKEAVDVVNKKFADAKGKISQDKIPYVRAIFVGGLRGLEEYRKSLNTVTLSAGYETDLVKEYNAAKVTL